MKASGNVAVVPSAAGGLDRRAFSLERCGQSDRSAAVIWLNVSTETLVAVRSPARPPV